MLSERINQIQNELNPKKDVSFELDDDFHVEMPANQIISHAKTLEEKLEARSFPKKDYSEAIKEIEILISTGDIPKPGKPIQERKFGYKRVKKGGLLCFNKDELKCQEGIVLELLRTVGKTLMEGKNVVGVSLPVRIFEPRSSVERICDSWAFAPIYLRMASRINSPIERMRLVISYFVAGLHNVCKQLKPFNPILGETFQGYFDDGTSIFVEHTSHHPPISSFLVEGEGFKFWGYYHYSGRLTRNSLIASQDGPTYIQFSDGQTIKFRMPSVVIGGLIFGDRVITWSGIIPFEDVKNGIKATLTFYEGGFLSNQHTLDYVQLNFHN